MRIAIDSDSNGLQLKNILFSFFQGQEQENTEIENLNYLSRYPEQDYPDVALNMAGEILTNRYDRGILICGTGLGMAICANKIPGIYAGSCSDVYSAERLAKSNDANILTLGANVIGPELAKKIVMAWVSSDFEGGRSLPKVKRIREIEAAVLNKEILFE